MKASDFIRDASRVNAVLKKTDNNELVCTRPIKVHIPARFPERDLAVIESEISFVGICAMIVDDKYYGVSKINAFMRTEPSLINTLNVDDVDYIEFSYDAGARVVANLNLVKVDNLLYRIYDEFIAKGRVPWYMGYQDMGGLFETSVYHAGASVGANPAVMEMIIAAICRSPDDVKQYYRQYLQSMDQLATNPPSVIPLRAVSYGATNAIAKLMGPYFDENVTSTLISPGERVERVEKLLRL